MRENLCFACIMASRSHTLYIGVTSNQHKRVFQHKWREHAGFTEKYNCDRLVWFEIYQEIAQAIAREKQLKGWRRDKKIALIEKANPAWIDLSKDWYDLGVTQKTAWFLDHRIRLMLGDEYASGKLGGEVEADETFIGGKARNMHKSKRERRITGTGGKDKTAVMGLLERGGNVRTKVISSRKKKELHTEVKKHVEAGAALYTDALMSYRGLEKDFVHQVVDHAVEYVNGRVHTNGLENFWSLLKRGINGTYVSIEPFHLFRYLDEQSFRFNNRKLTDAQRFDIATRGMVGKRLTLAELTGNARPLAI
jgi:predicted GIY-YIG superfamily endonuclease/transposase-like protein